MGALQSAKAPTVCATFPVGPSGGSSLASSLSVQALSCGRSHSLALLSDGQAYALGDSSLGQTGLGTRRACVPVPSPITELAGGGAGPASASVVRLIAAGHDHCLALTSAGRLFSWGFNSDGQLGVDLSGSLREACQSADDTAALVCPTPRLVVQCPSNVAGLRCGADSSAYFTDDGSVVCWGGVTSPDVANRFVSGSAIGALAAAGAYAVQMLAAPVAAVEIVPSGPEYRVADLCFVGNALVLLAAGGDRLPGQRLFMLPGANGPQESRDAQFFALSLPESLAGGSERITQLESTQSSLLIRTDAHRVYEAQFRQSEAETAEPDPFDKGADAPPASAGDRLEVGPFECVSFGSSLVQAMAAGPTQTIFLLNKA